MGLWVAVVAVSLLGFWRLVCGLWCTFEHHVNRFGVRMSIFLRLREERERLGFSQEAFGVLGGVQKRAQINYEKGERIAQLVIIATPSITLHNIYELPESSRGAQGFGSSGLS